MLPAPKFRSVAVAATICTCVALAAARPAPFSGQSQLSRSVLAGSNARISADRSGGATTSPGAPLPMAAADPLPGPNSPLVADPPIPRPASTPCVVTLVDNFLISEDSYGSTFNYVPPAGCTGAWAKVVLEADYAFDEGALPVTTAMGLWLKGANLQFGSTPVAEETPSQWHVERDLTDMATLFRRSGTGSATMASLFRDPSAYVRLTARLLFYPASTTAPSPRKADAVFVLGTPGRDQFGADLGVSENNPKYPPSELASTLSLPRNIERLYLDVLALDPSGTLWWTCVPNELRAIPNLLPDGVGIGSGIGGCGDGTFRETEVRIDGQAAGVAPVLPWSPASNGGQFGAIPSPRMLNLLPYRVDLTPFAGVLSDGRPHKIAVTMATSDPADEISSASLEVSANLLVYRDPHSTTVSGAITRNTLATQPSVPTLTNTLVSSGGALTGGIATSLRRDFIIDGYIDTARGRISNRVVQTVLFSNTQAFDNFMSASQYRYQQDAQLVSKVWRNSYSSLGSTQLRRDNEYFSYPLHLFFHKDYPIANAGSATPTTLRTLSSGVHHTGRYDRSNIARYDSDLHNTYQGLAETHLEGGVFTGHAESAQDYLFQDNRGSCYDRTVTDDSGVRTSVSGTSCPDGVNRLRSIARPDGSPESLGWAGWQ